MTQEDFNKILKDFGESTVATIIKVMQSKNIKWRGNLQRSIKAKYGNNVVEFIMSDYGQYLDKGTGRFGIKGTPIPKKSIPGIAFHIKEWAKSKGLNEWAVATNIQKRGGLQPRRFFDKTIEDEIGKLELDYIIIEYLEARVKFIDESE